MSITVEERTIIRHRFNYRCGYCGVHEIWFDDELEIDHFQPLKYGGTDALENLVYACARCNRYKASYWADANIPQHRHLLHPHYDDIALHIAQNPDGQFVGLTSRGGISHSPFASESSSACTVTAVSCCCQQNQTTTNPSRTG